MAYNNKQLQDQDKNISCHGHSLTCVYIAQLENLSFKFEPLIKDQHCSISGLKFWGMNKDRIFQTAFKMHF